MGCRPPPSLPTSQAIECDVYVAGLVACVIARRTPHVVWVVGETDDLVFRLNEDAVVVVIVLALNAPAVQTASSDEQMNHLLAVREPVPLCGAYRLIALAISRHTFQIESAVKPMGATINSKR